MKIKEESMTIVIHLLDDLINLIILPLKRLIKKILIKHQRTRKNNPNKKNIFLLKRNFKAC